MRGHVLEPSYVIPTGIATREERRPLKCGVRQASRRGPSTSLRMTTVGLLSFVSVTNVAKRVCLPKTVK